MAPDNRYVPAPFGFCQLKLRRAALHHLGSQLFFGRGNGLQSEMKICRLPIRLDNVPYHVPQEQQEMIGYQIK